MNRRSFSIFTAVGLALPLVARASRADELEGRAVASGDADPTTPSTALTADEIVTRVAAVYDKLTTFKADFRQGNRLLPYDKNKRPAGSLVFEKPTSMSWRYRSGNRVVSDGHRIKIYECDNQQMYELDPERTQYPAALSFLTAQRRFSQNFHFSKVDVDAKLERAHLLLGEPRQPSPAYERLVLYVDAATYEVRRVLLIDAQGNRNRFDFVHSASNPRVPRSEFTFTPPSSTRIVRM
ncbi:MAG: outer membrane lipoprotein carrier protein LolA [Polyangiaceae bacterium]